MPDYACQQCNIVLALTKEYRLVEAKVQDSSSTRTLSKSTTKFEHRYVGLVVVPGHRIVKIEYQRIPKYGII